MATTVKQCTACGSPDVRNHCESRACDCWRCVRCLSFGTARRLFDNRPRETR